MFQNMTIMDSIIIKKSVYPSVLFCFFNLSSEYAIVIDVIVDSWMFVVVAGEVSEQCAG